MPTIRATTNTHSGCAHLGGMNYDLRGYLTRSCIAGDTTVTSDTAISNCSVASDTASSKMTFDSFKVFFRNSSFSVLFPLPPPSFYFLDDLTPFCSLEGAPYRVVLLVFPSPFSIRFVLNSIQEEPPSA